MCNCNLFANNPIHGINIFITYLDNSSSYEVARAVIPIVFHNFECWYNIDNLSANWLDSIFYLQIFLFPKHISKEMDRRKMTTLRLFYQYFLRNSSVAPHQYSAKQIFCLFMILAISHIMKKSLCRPCK